MFRCRDILAIPARAPYVDDEILGQLGQGLSGWASQTQRQLSQRARNLIFVEIGRQRRKSLTRRRRGRRDPLPHQVRHHPAPRRGPDIFFTL
jgi:hypothetical protein